MKELFIDYNPFFVRAALVEEGVLTEFGVEHVATRGHVGNIYKGKVENVLGGMKAAFVNIGLERNGFLYIGEDGDDKRKNVSSEMKKISAGDVVMCQVVKEQFNMKGARLTIDVTLPGYYMVLLPDSSFCGVSRKIEDDERRRYLEELVRSVCPDDAGFIVRSAAVAAGDDEITEEAGRLYSLWKRIKGDFEKASPTSLVFREAQLLERVIRDNYGANVDRVVVNDAALAASLTSRIPGAEVELYEGKRNIFKHFGISEQVDKLTDRRVEIAGGAYLVIDRTEALTVIDVNTGRFVGSKNLEDTVYKTNLAAAVEVAKQLRLRNISGIVIIDFIDMQTEEHKRAVLEVLREELKKDKLKTSVVSMTELGLVELTRKRTRLPADSFMLEPCKECSGGYVASAVHLALKLRDEMVEFSLANDGFRAITARVNPDICDKIFEVNLMSREASGVWHGKRVYILPDPSKARDEWEISGSNEKVLTLPSDARLLF